MPVCLWVPKEIMQVCRNVMTATRVQTLHLRQADSLQQADGSEDKNTAVLCKCFLSSAALALQVLNAQRSRMQGQPRIKLEVTKKATGPLKSPKAGARHVRGMLQRLECGQ